MPDIIDMIHFQELSAQSPSQVCRRAACTYDDAGQFYALAVWDHDYHVYPHQGKVESADRNTGKLHPYFDLFVIHYLLRAQEIEPARQWISEKDIPGGTTFFRGPHAIPTELISGRFANDMHGFKEKCAHLQGNVLGLADAAYMFAITPRIPVAVLYWQGDEEFPPEAKILYDRTIAEHLAGDVIYALAVGICERFQE